MYKKKEFKSVTFRAGGKRHTVPVKERNIYGEPMVYLPLSDYSTIIVTQKHDAGDGPRFNVQHFEPVEKTPLLNGFTLISKPTLCGTCRTRFGLRCKLGRLFRELEKKDVHLRWF